MSKLDPGNLYDEPMRVMVEGSAVVVLGPDAVAISITADAAEQSARRLLEAAETARRSDGPEAPVLPIDQQ